MLRPLVWTERVEAAAGLEDLELGVFASDGTQIFTVSGTEEFPTIYRAYVELNETYAGATYILRWRSVATSWQTILTVFVTGETLTAEAIASMATEVPDPPAYADGSQWEPITCWIFNSSDTVPIPQYSAVRLAAGDRDGAEMALNDDGEFFGVVQSGLGAGATQSQVIVSGPTRVRATAEAWAYSDPLYLDVTAGVVTSDPDLTTPGVWVVPIGNALADKAADEAIGYLGIVKGYKYVVEGAE